MTGLPAKPLTHDDYQRLARFARDLVRAVERYGGSDGHPSINEERTRAALRYALDNPDDLQHFPLDLTKRKAKTHV